MGANHWPTSSSRRYPEMISAAWLNVVKRPFASDVAIASEADSNRLRERPRGGAVGGDSLPTPPGPPHRVGEGGHDLRRHSHRVEHPAFECRVRGRRRRSHPPRRRAAPALTHEWYEATMASFIRARLFSADSVTLCGASPRLTHPLMISRAWIGCSSSYFACSSSHQRPRGPIFSFFASPRRAFSEIFCAKIGRASCRERV